jgi:hypothetical protein
VTPDRTIYFYLFLPHIHTSFSMVMQYQESRLATEDEEQRVRVLLQCLVAVMTVLTEISDTKAIQGQGGQSGSKGRGLNLSSSSFSAAAAAAGGGGGGGGNAFDALGGGSGGEGGLGSGGDPFLLGGGNDDSSSSSMSEKDAVARKLEKEIRQKALKEDLQKKEEEDQIKFEAERLEKQDPRLVCLCSLSQFSMSVICVWRKCYGEVIYFLFLLGGNRCGSENGFQSCQRWETFSTPQT